MKREADRREGVIVAPGVHVFKILRLMIVAFGVGAFEEKSSISFAALSV